MLYVRNQGVMVLVRREIICQLIVTMVIGYIVIHAAAAVLYFIDVHKGIQTDCLDCKQ